MASKPTPLLPPVLHMLLLSYAFTLATQYSVRCPYFISQYIPFRRYSEALQQHHPHPT